MGGGMGIFGGRTDAAGKGGAGIATGSGETGLISAIPILAEALPIFISGNFISPK